MAVGNVRMAYRAPLKKNSEATAYYVFNATSSQGSKESGQGFVIVSGDDRTVPILGYADKGVFDPDRLAGLPAIISDPTVGAKSEQFFDDSEPAESPAADAITISTAQHRSVWDE